MAWRRGQAHGQDVRGRVLACPDLPLVEVATQFDVSPSFLPSARARWRARGDAAPRPKRSRHLRSGLLPER